MPISSPALLDTRYPLETPEGVDLLLQPAGLLPRLLAFLIDLLIRGGIVLLFSIALVSLGRFGWGLWSICFFVISWWYPVLFEVLWQGRTPGKRYMGLRVVHADGTPIGWSASLIRNLLRTVDMLPLCYSAGIISLLFSQRLQRIGDLAANTLVVYREAPLNSAPLPEAPEVIPPHNLQLDEQLAILDYAERFAQLSPERRQELADILCPTLKLRPEHAQASLLGMARFLRGHA